MPFDIELVLLSNRKELPPEYYDGYIGNYSDIIDRPLAEALGKRFQALSGTEREVFTPQITAAISTLEQHPKSASLAYEQALKTLRDILEKSAALPQAVLFISREGRSGLGEPKISGLTLDDLEAGRQRDDDNLDGDWAYDDDDGY